MSNSEPSRIVLMMLLRNNAYYVKHILPLLLTRIRSSVMSLPVKFLLYENDSTDDTLHLLQQLAHTYTDIEVFTEKIGNVHQGRGKYPEKPIFLSQFRNELLDRARIQETDLVIIVDSDISWGGKLDVVEMCRHKFRSDPDLGMITANGRDFVTGPGKLGSYYDGWALKITNPFDRHKFETILRANVDVEVESAFGGLAVVKGCVFSKNDVHYASDGGCEHWEFCKRIRDKGYKIIVWPELVVVHELTKPKV